MFISSAFYVWELMWDQINRLAQMAACATQTRLFCDLCWQRKGERHVRVFQLVGIDGVPWRWEHKADMWPTLSPFPALYKMALLLDVSSSRSQCMPDPSRWVTAAKWQSGVEVVGTVLLSGSCAHSKGCLRLSIFRLWELKCSWGSEMSTRLILNPRYAATLALHSFSHPALCHLVADSSFPFSAVPTISLFNSWVSGFCP